MQHELKCWPQYFEAMLTGQKTFEYRKNDRDFSIGDTLHLREYGPRDRERDDLGTDYTNRNMRVLVQSVWVQIPGLPQDYCIMQTQLLEYW